MLSSRAFSGPSLGHLGSIWGRLWAMTGHLEAFWGLLGLSLRPLSAVPGAACRLLENSNESGMTWGWGGVGGAGFRSRLGPWMTYTRGLPIPKVIRATSQQVNIYIYIYRRTNHIFQTIHSIRALPLSNPGPGSVELRRLSQAIFGPRFGPRF